MDTRRRTRRRRRQSGSRRYLPASGVGTRGISVALLSAIDAVAFAVAAFTNDGGAVVVVVLAPLIAGSVLLHALALVRLAPLIAQRSAGATAAAPGFDAGLAASVGGKAREAAGIVRARAEALRLAAEEAGVAELLGHDLDVLVRQAEECQRVLRELDAAPAVRGGGAARLPPPAVPEPEPWPSASTPQQS